MTMDDTVGLKVNENQLWFTEFAMTHVIISAEVLENLSLRLEDMSQVTIIQNMYMYNQGSPLKASSSLRFTSS